MKNFLKKFTSFSAVITLLALQISFLLPPTLVNAVTANDADIMCVPPVNPYNNDFSEDTSGDDKAQRWLPANNWLTLRFLNRNQIEVTINAAGKDCDTPSGATIPMTSISTSDNSGLTKSLLEGVFGDINTTDGNWSYVKGEDTIEGTFLSQDDDRARIRGFSDGGGLKSATADSIGLFTKSVDVDTLRNHIGTANAILGFDNALVDNILDCKKDRSDNNDNFILRGDSEGRWGWECQANIGDSNAGVSVRDSYTDLENFNITYVVVGTGTDTKIVPTQALAKQANGDGIAIESSDTFSYCADSNGGVFRNNNCRSGSEYEINETPESLAAKSTIDRFSVTINRGAVQSQVTVSGANSSITASSIALTGDGITVGPSCESEGGAFSFVLCPLLSFADGAIAKLDGRIFDALLVTESSYGDPGIKTAWSRLRNIGYVILIPIMLIMVIGTALGFSVVDAYTVKRALPRLFAAIIFMALSFDVAVIMIEVTNGIGQGISGLIAQPFGGLDNLQLDDIFTGGAGVIAGETAVIAGSAALILGGFVSIGIIASYMFVGALVLLIVFVLLALRRVLLVALILLAPLAIISWIFPGNDKLWKLWWNSFSKLLMLFPLVILLLTTGRVFAGVVDASEGGLFGTVIKLTAFIGPYFFIPTAFKFAGSAFGNLAGMVNDRSKGVFDRQRKFRADKRQENYKLAREGKRFRNTPGLRKLNTKAQSLMLQKDAGMSVGGTRRGRIEAARTRNNLQNMEEMLEKNPDYSPWKNDDGVNYAASLWAQNGESDAASLRRRLIAQDPSRFEGNNNRAELNKTVEQIMATRKTTGDAAFMQATALQAIAGGTVIKSDEGTNNAAAKAAKFVSGATRGDGSARANLVAKYRSAAINAGRIEQGISGFGATYKAVEAFDNPNADLEIVNEELMDNVIDSAPAGHALHGKPESMKNIAVHRRKKLQRIANNIGKPDPVTGNITTKTDFTRELASTMGMLDAAGSAAPMMAKELANELTGASIVDPISGQSMTVLDLANHPTYLADDAFSQMRNDFKASNLRGSQAFQAQQAAQRAAQATYPGQQNFGTPQNPTQGTP